MNYGHREETSTEQAARIARAESTMRTTYKKACNDRRGGLMVYGIVRGGGCSG